MQFGSSETFQNKLSKDECKRCSVPAGGLWFSRQASMFEAKEKVLPGGGFLVAWDKDGARKQASKIYGLYPDATTFYQNLLQNPVDKRHGYELIPENSPCKLYADVEWEGPADESHQKIYWILNKLRDYVRKVHADERTLEVYVCCGSRQINDRVFKNSYHVVCPSVVYAKNNDGQLKSFMHDLCGGDESDQWYYLNAEGNKKCYVDLSVYSKNRVIRLPGCCKLGSKTPLVRISGANEGEGKSYSDMQDPECWAPFIITNPQLHSGQIIVTANVQPSITKTGPPLARPLKRKRRDSGPLDTKIEPESKHVEPVQAGGSLKLPLQPSQLEDALRQVGDSVSTVSKVQFKHDVQGGMYWQVQCDQKKQPRPCLADKKLVHESNNCLLFIRACKGGTVSMAETQQLALEYHCTSESCKHAQNLVLGVFSLDPACNTWRYCDILGANQTEKLAPIPPHQDHKEEQQSLSETLEPEGQLEGTPVTSEISQEMDMEQARETESQASGQLTTTQPQEEKPEDNTYVLVKQRFEECCFKVRNPFLYVRLEYIGMDRSRVPDVCLLKHSELQNFYCHLHYFEKPLDNSSEQSQANWRKRNFISAWLRDPHKKEVSNIVVDPKGTRADSFNLWTGYLADTQTPTLTIGNETFENESIAAEFALAPIYKHILEVVADGNENHAQWLLDWIANIVQRPWQKSQVAIMLYGKQGCGKGIIFDWLRKNVLGPKHTFQTADPENDLFGRFSQGLVNVSLVQVDEVKNLHEYADKIKDAITNRTVKLEKKNKDPVVVDAFANIIFTSNNENALKVSVDDRRTVLFRCNSIYKGNKQYFDSLAHHLNLDGVACWFYKILKERDLSKYPYDFQSSRPMTAYYKESQNASIPVEKRYLSAYINGEGPTEITSDNMYKNFQMWADLENVKLYIKAHNAFGREMKRVHGVVVHRTKNCNIYKIDRESVRNFLLENKEFDEEAVLHEQCQENLHYLIR